MPLFRTAVFHTTVADLRDLPADAQHEVAFAGRSNAGKSSAINTLADHSRLAFVSKTPGRTQHLNYFRLADGKYFVDLPGYGFAKAPEEVRGQWEGLLAPYLHKRSVLRGLVLIMDCRHPLTELDLQMLGWFAQTGKPVHVLLSKADKLSWQAQCLALRAVEQALRAFGDHCSAQVFSSLKKIGVQDAEKVLASWLEMVPEVEKTAPAGLRVAKTARVRPRSAVGWGARQNAAKR
ncbi:MAG TPA: ribosome biogenesis GTP-binding protein YihA/YsxC [Accumulibacter sp.]|nr:ribosome biogenesis GTP-binding protein YihA/YsxC [Accumulibacter sp.]